MMIRTAARPRLKETNQAQPKQDSIEADRDDHDSKGFEGTARNRQRGRSPAGRGV